MSGLYLSSEALDKAPQKLYISWSMLHRSINMSKSNSFFLFGARGTGKSTLLKKEFIPSLTGKSLYIDLLQLAVREQFEMDPDSLESQILPSTEWVVIDEIQKTPHLLDTIHRLIEEKGIKFAMTGSSARKLKAGGANLLAGRAFVYELFPLTHMELKDEFDLCDVLSWGSLPKLLEFSEPIDKQLFLEAYTRTYLKEEIWDEHLVRSLNPFRKFLQVSAQANGTIINYSKIARDVGVDVKTVQQYFQILEDTLLGFMIEPYEKSPRKRLKQNPKFYLFDIGIARSLTRDFALQFTETSMGFGYRFEHFLISEILRLNSYAQTRFEFSFIRTKDDDEVDLVIDRPGKPLVLLEIKSAKHIQEKHVATLLSFHSSFPDSEFYCFSRDPHPRQYGPVTCLPWQEGVCELGLVANQVGSI